MLPRHIVEMLARDGYRASHPAAYGAATEADYDGLHVRVMSAPKARAYTPGPREIAISIRGPGEPEIALSSQFSAILRLVFADTGDFAPARVDNADTPDTITTAQAEELVAFVQAHRDACILVLHCAAGVSRSRSAAAAICAVLDLPYEFCVVNESVYRIVLRAFSMTTGSDAAACE